MPSQWPLCRQSLALVHATTGRPCTILVVMVSLAGVNSGPSQPSFTASMRISPGRLLLCRITCARPLNSERFGSLSLSWQLGSPLPTPMSFPSPETLKPIKFPAVGTGTSSPSASISVLSAVSRITTAGPVVSRFSVSTTAPPFDPRASIDPGSYFTFHSTWPRCGTFLLPRLCPLTNSSTSSMFEYTQTGIRSPSLPSKFQCGNRCSDGSLPHHAL